MLVNINPQLSDFEETLHVLANSALAQTVTTSKDTAAADRQVRSSTLHAPLSESLTLTVSTVLCSLHGCLWHN